MWHLKSNCAQNFWEIPRKIFFRPSKIKQTVCYQLALWIWKMMNANVFIKISLSASFNLIENLFWLNRWLEVNALTYTDSVSTTNYVFLSAEMMLAKKRFLGDLIACLIFAGLVVNRNFGFQFWFFGLWFFIKHENPKSHYFSFLFIFVK